MAVFAGDLRQIIDGTKIDSGYNNTGSEIGAGLFVKLATTGDRHVILPAAVTDDLFGVTLRAIPAGEWGDIQVEGRARCVAGAALATPGIRLMPTTAGKVVTWTAATGANVAVAGTNVTTASADNDAVEVTLAGKNVSRQG
jgi:predicted RecA/RadA family phage recombinase